MLHPSGGICMPTSCVKRPWNRLIYINNQTFISHYKRIDTVKQSLLVLARSNYKPLHFSPSHTLRRML